MSSGGSRVAQSGVIGVSSERMLSRDIAGVSDILTLCIDPIGGTGSTDYSGGFRWKAIR